VSIEHDPTQAHIEVDGTKTSLPITRFIAVANGRDAGADVDERVRSALNVVGS
jgi:hypothetical protein